MARITGVAAQHSGWIGRLIFFFARRKIGKEPMPLKIVAHRRGLLRGTAVMELAQGSAHRMPALYKILAQLKVASLVGCPF